MPSFFTQGDSVGGLSTKDFTDPVAEFPAPPEFVSLAEEAMDLNRKGRLMAQELGLLKAKADLTQTKMERITDTFERKIADLSTGPAVLLSYDHAGKRFVVFAQAGKGIKSQVPKAFEHLKFESESNQ